MARKKTAAELADEVRKLEARLAKAKEKEQIQSKAEEARKNADIIKAVREYWSALPSNRRPDWEDMPAFIRRKILASGDEVKKVSSQLLVDE